MHCRAAGDKGQESVSSDISQTGGNILSVNNSLHVLMGLLTRLIIVDALPFRFLLFVLIFFAVSLSYMLVTQEKPTITVLIKLLQVVSFSLLSLYYCIVGKNGDALFYSSLTTLAVGFITAGPTLYKLTGPTADLQDEEPT